MPRDRALKIKACRARIARYEKLRAGFSREAHLLLQDGLFSGYERQTYLAAVNRILLSLGEARQALEIALATMGERIR